MANRKFMIAIVFLLACAGAERLCAQDSLRDARGTAGIVENQRAQAEYYRAQTEKLRSEPSDWLKVIADIAAPIVTFVAALFSVLMFLSKQKVTTKQFRKRLEDADRQKQEQQFYEALKRFGDPRSPALRLGAVGVLRSLITEKSDDPHRRKYLQIVADQFIASLLVEKNPAVLKAIGELLKELGNKDPVLASRAYSYLYRVTSQDLERDLAQNFIDLVVLSGGEMPGDRDEDWLESAEGKRYTATLSRAEQLTQVCGTSIEAFVGLRLSQDEGAESLRSPLTGSVNNPEQRERQTILMEKRLQVAAWRLRVAAEVAAAISPEGQKAANEIFVKVGRRFGQGVLRPPAVEASADDLRRTAASQS
jgi:hypothetical protein